MDWKEYNAHDFYDELIKPGGEPRDAAAKVANYIARLSNKQIRSRQTAAEKALIEMGITFTVYSEGENIDRAWPMDIIPRIIDAGEWETVQKGLAQRLKALNMFIDDVYHNQDIVKEGIVPSELLDSSKDFLPQCVGITPKHGVWAHICGSDLVRDGDGTIYVLEDNLRVPSGVSYMIENRAVTKRVFPELFSNVPIRPVDAYPHQLFDMLVEVSPRDKDDPEIVVMTPGVFNSAYFEHSFLAQRMGTELVEGSDLVVENDIVYMRNIEGLKRVDTIYRRVNDAFLDPEVFNPESKLGTPGLFAAWAKGNVALVNAPGAGVADDKVLYSYVPDIIRFYLSEEPILANVPTYRCSDPEQLKYVTDHLEALVVKPANESGGYGMLVGPAATKAEISAFRKLIKENPRNYIGQPTLQLSTAPTITGETIEPRHLDLRPFILQGKESWVTPGGLTRVALRKGSLVVNSSQGGGSKDTWIVGER
ncbi:MAG: circularly permuted type 2 ATP-grasp protein [Pseudomonadaceae bacterium]|nr:circularly permuted type 2 ATP-grasp protein [Pseudomonadaceae bacterium]